MRSKCMHLRPTWSSFRLCLRKILLLQRVVALGDVLFPKPWSIPIYLKKKNKQFIKISIQFHIHSFFISLIIIKILTHLVTSTTGTFPSLRAANCWRMCSGIKAQMLSMLIVGQWYFCLCNPKYLIPTFPK